MRGTPSRCCWTGCCTACARLRGSCAATEGVRAVRSRGCGAVFQSDGALRPSRVRHAPIYEALHRHPKQDNELPRCPRTYQQGCPRTRRTTRSRGADGGEPVGQAVRTALAVSLQARVLVVRGLLCSPVDPLAGHLSAPLHDECREGPWRAVAVGGGHPSVLLVRSAWVAGCFPSRPFIDG